MVERTDARYGRGEHAISDSEEASALAGEGLAERLEAVFAAPGYKPPVLPAVALEVHELTRTPDVPLARIVGLLERDAMLAAGVLRLAQSPAYASRHAPRTLDETVTRLGLKALRDLVWEVAAGRIFRVPAYQDAMETLRAHSIATARLARAVAAYTSVAADQAFLCGLLHDVGVAIALIALAEGNRRPPPVADVAADVGAVHEKAGQRVAELWKLPLDVQLVLGNHHVPRVGGHAHPLACVVAVAHGVVTEHGMTIDLGVGEGYELVEPQATSYAAHALGLTPAQREAIDRDAAVLCASCSFAA